jgi:hypothetical protein
MHLLDGIFNRFKHSLGEALPYHCIHASATTLLQLTGDLPFDGASRLTVRKVIPTLTSKSAKIGLLIAGAKQHNDTGLSWFRLWAVRPAGVRSWRCIAWHRGVTDRQK